MWWANISFHYTDHPLLNALKTLLNDYYYNPNIRIIDPSDFKTVKDVVLPEFKGKEQQDANEFFIQLLNELDKEFKVISKENSIINDIFMGETLSKVTCDVCKNNSIKIEEFLFLQLVVPVLKNKKTKYVEVKYFHYKKDKNINGIKFEAFDVLSNNIEKYPSGKFNICKFNSLASRN